MPERRERLAGRASITSGLFVERSEVLRNLRHASKAKDTDRRGGGGEGGEETRGKRKSSTVYLEWARNGHRQLVSK